MNKAVVLKSKPLYDEQSRCAYHGKVRYTMNKFDRRRLNPLDNEQSRYTVIKAVTRRAKPLYDEQSRHLNNPSIRRKGDKKMNSTRLMLVCRPFFVRQAHSILSPEKTPVKTSYCIIPLLFPPSLPLSFLPSLPLSFLTKL